MFEFITQEYFERWHDFLSEKYPIQNKNTYVCDSEGESLIAYYEPPEKYTLPKKITLEFDSVPELLHH